MDNTPIILVCTYAFTYQSAGIYSQHKLCHLLRQNNFDARLVFIKGPSKTNPEWETPIWEGSRQRRISVAIYPELIHANPLKATISVNWILGKFIIPPEMNKKTHTFYWDSSDGNHLELNILDVKSSSNPTQIRNKQVLVYRGKNRTWSPRQWEGMELTYIDRFGKNQISSIDFRDRLKECAAILVGEESQVIAEAILSGCPVIVRAGTNLPTYATEIKGIYFQTDDLDWPKISDLAAQVPSGAKYLKDRNSKIEKTFNTFCKFLDEQILENFPSASPRAKIPYRCRFRIKVLRMRSAYKYQGISGVSNVIRESIFRFRMMGEQSKPF